MFLQRFVGFYSSEWNDVFSFTSLRHTNQSAVIQTFSDPCCVIYISEGTNDTGQSVWRKPEDVFSLRVEAEDGD